MYTEVQEMTEKAKSKTGKTQIIPVVGTQKKFWYKNN